MNTNLNLKIQPVNFDRLKVAHIVLRNTITKPKYFIEDVNFCGDKVTVIYIDEAILNSGVFTETDWKEASFYYGHLKDFIYANGLNTYENNTSDQDGCHVQVSGCVPIKYYLSENINVAVKAYLEAGKDITNV